MWGMIRPPGSDDSSSAIAVADSASSCSLPLAIVSARPWARPNKTQQTRTHGFIHTGLFSQDRKPTNNFHASSLLSLALSSVVRCNRASTRVLPGPFSASEAWQKNAGSGSVLGAAQKKPSQGYLHPEIPQFLIIYIICMQCLQYG